MLFETKTIQNHPISLRKSDTVLMFLVITNSMPFIKDKIFPDMILVFCFAHLLRFLVCVLGDPDVIQSLTDLSSFIYFILISAIVTLSLESNVKIKTDLTL